MQSFEKLGAFYLGRLYDQAKGEATAQPLLYDARDLTTHAVCVGMTGSGKTGLCLSLLEEAALDGIPALVIDPKGDVCNLALTFPELRPADFRPWVDPQEAARQGLDADQLAERTARQWREGLAAWGQDGERIGRFASSVDLAIYTPGSGAGLPLSVLGSLSAPAAGAALDADALVERASATASGLLALVGVEADPIRSREHILIATILDRAWRQGRAVGIEDLIRQVQAPPVEKVGVMDVESFYPAKDRRGLAMTLNNLLASPAFASWLQGEAMDVGHLLHTGEGKPRLSICYIAHLSDAERMFFVTLLLNEVVAWMRRQTGTGSLRALLYMDEVFGFFPPTANPPCKAPMLTLLKQARAFGLGVVLATQNPVDLDYKGLSNAGTWFLGRLQTERDKSRVIEGLEGASQAAGRGFDRQSVEATLAGLKSRVFLMHNVHEDRPVLFQTRWALSYLRGPLARAEIQSLPAERALIRPAAVDGGVPAPEPVRTAAAPDAPAATTRPIPPAGIEERFLTAGAAGEGGTLTYRPALLGKARVHYVDARAGVDAWEDLTLLAALPPADPANPWEGAGEATSLAAEGSGLDPSGRFADLPAAASRANSYELWGKALAGHLYRARPLRLWRCDAVKEVSRADESEAEFRVRLKQNLRERRDAAVDHVRDKYAPKLASLQERVRTAEQRVSREQSQLTQQNVQTAISLGATLLGAMLGRKAVSAGGLGRATTAARGAARASREKEDVARAAESLETLRKRLADLEGEFQSEVSRIQEGFDPDRLELSEIRIPPRKSDIAVQSVVLAWCPHSG